MEPNEHPDYKSSERIAAALALAASFVEYDEKYGRFVDWDPVLKQGLDAYRAALPVLRTQSEVDADLATACRAAVESNQMCGALFIQYVRQLCKEPVR